MLEVRSATPDRSPADIGTTVTAMIGGRLSRTLRVAPPRMVVAPKPRLCARIGLTSTHLNDTIRIFATSRARLQNTPTTPNANPKPAVQKNVLPGNLGKIAAKPKEDVKTNREQRKADWAIMKEMAKYLWPKVSKDLITVSPCSHHHVKDKLGIKIRVGLALGLLVSAKVLNVYVPFFFKAIIDGLNVDFLSVGGTVWTVAGSLVVGCESKTTWNLSAILTVRRWSRQSWSNSIPGDSQCNIRQSRPVCN